MTSPGIKIGFLQTLKTIKLLLKVIHRYNLNKTNILQESCYALEFLFDCANNMKQKNIEVVVAETRGPCCLEYP